MADKVSCVWKVLAIIFMILFLLLSLYFGYLLNEGNKNIGKENHCIVNVCGPYDAYSYDWTTDLCACYSDGEVVYEEVIR